MNARRPESRTRQLTLPISANMKNTKPMPTAVLPSGSPLASWEVKSRAAVCLATGKNFEPGETVCSRLVARLDGVYREDFCQAAWNDALREEALFHWKTRFRPPAPKKEPPFREENAEVFLRELLERQDPALKNTVFILAVMLERKRILIERAVQPDADGRRIRIYEHRDDGETFFIHDPGLNLSQIADVQQEVAEALGWIKPAEQAEAETATEKSEDN